MNLPQTQEAAAAARSPDTAKKTETARKRESDQFFQEQKEVVNLSIDFHGGPYEGCQECGIYNAECFDAPSLEAKRRILDRWAKHIGLD